MKAGKIASVVSNFIKGGYWFGLTFSNRVTETLDVSPTAARVGGGIFDTLAGAGVTYYAGMSAVGTTLATIAAAGTIMTTPVHAIVTVPVGIIFLALELTMGGIGLGLLDAARIKAGIPKPSFSFFSKAGAAKKAVKSGANKTVAPFQAAVTNSSRSVKNIFSTGAEKLSVSFRKAISVKEASVKAVKKMVLENKFRPF